MLMNKQMYKPLQGITSGPYSPAIGMDPLVFTSGQGTYDPDTGEKYLGDIQKQTEIAIKNLQRVLESAGLSFPDIIKVTLYLTSSEFLEPADSVYAEFFSFPHPPARTIIIVPALPGEWV